MWPVSVLQLRGPLVGVPHAAFQQLWLFEPGGSGGRLWWCGLQQLCIFVPCRSLQQRCCLWRCGLQQRCCLWWCGLQQLWGQELVGDPDLIYIYIYIIGCSQRKRQRFFLPNLFFHYFSTTEARQICKGNPKKTKILDRNSQMLLIYSSTDISRYIRSLSQRAF